MSEGYQIVDRADSPSPLDPKKLAKVLAKEGQFLLPIVNLIENAQAAIDDLIDVMGRATIEAVLLIAPRRSPDPSGKERKPGATSSITARRRDASLSRSVNSASTSRDSANASRNRASPARSKSRPMRRCQGQSSRRPDARHSNQRRLDSTI